MNNDNPTNEKLQFMTDGAKQIHNLILNRMNSRLEALKAFEPANLSQLPDEVKVAREVEASRIRAVVQEQKDLLEIIKIIYPNV